ncbi:MAG: glycosyltransferase family 4 protein [Anaerolineales bacterium]|nr:glycosyltransferase family 4 protein [Anaerolineales bacterium]MDW8447284.1 glycosyltransferase family 4 protein [Anaerolineales bacterium]
MRLGLVIYGSLAQQTGGYLYDRKIVEYLQAQGDQIEVLSLPWRNQVAHLGDNFSLSLLRKLSNLKVELLIEDELNHPSLVGINWLLRRRNRFVLCGLVHHLRCSEAESLQKQWLYRTLESFFLNSLDGLICNSRSTLSTAQALLWRKNAHSIPSVVAYPGKDHLSGGCEKEEIEKRARRSASLRLIFVGNLIPRKGVHWLLCALDRLRDLPFHLDIVGDERRNVAYARSLRRWVTKRSLQARVRFWGAVEQSALQNLLRQAHVMVIPSRHEGFGIAYLDGMRYGLAVIGSACGGARELISEGVEGFLVEPGDVAALADQLRALHSDRRRLAQMGIAARERFEQHPTWGESAAEIRRFLLSLLN